MGFPLDTLVELLDQYSNVYPASPTGARGWVRARREMPKTDPEVYIEWDKSHWRYQGEHDGWTFEHHFREVAPEQVIEPDFTARQMLSTAERRVADERPNERERQTAFINTLLAAEESLLGSDGYFIVALRPRQEDGDTHYEPEIFAEVLDPIVAEVIEAQVLHAAIQIFERSLRDRMNRMENP